ncbi:MAG: hypothetical protein NTZ44_03325 [Candidatus Nomurabacteria bacterium]|nr:hypothetical protein [Candidatus Nomurabacteria bacterium]
MEKQLSMEAFRILADATNTKVEHLEEVYSNQKYRIFTIPKRSGGKRTIHAPKETTKLVQQSIYKNFLSKISTGPMIADYCYGGVPKRSTLGGIESHVFTTPNFIIDVDLKDAFHCVDSLSLKNALVDLLYDELCFYKFRYKKFLRSKNHREFLKKKHDTVDEEVINGLVDKKVSEITSNDSIFEAWESKNRYDLTYLDLRFKKRRLLFTNKANKALRAQIRKPNGLEEMYELCNDMAEILSKVLTYQNKLVQGSPTSPIAMALVLSHTKMISSFKSFLRYRTPKSYPDTHQCISVYVDNITISTDSYLSKVKLSKELRKVIATIEKTTIWKFNKKKIHIYEVGVEVPLVTGLRLVRHRKTRAELKEMVDDKIAGARHCLKAWTPWYYFRPTIPKKLQRKIRSALHHACIDAQQDVSLQDSSIQGKAKGYIGYILLVYKTYANIPSQLKKALEKYEKINPDALIKFYNQAIEK